MNAEEKESKMTDVESSETIIVDSPQSQSECSDESRDVNEAENLIEAYQVIGEWIRFADAKAAAVIAVNGALAGVLIPTVNDYLAIERTHPVAWWTSMVSVVFCCWLVSMVWSCVLAFRCINPYRTSGKHPAIGVADHFHPAAIASAYKLDQPDRFSADLERIGMRGLKQEISACIMIDSHISNAKYVRVSHGIRMLGLSAILALLYLLSIQF